MGACLDKDKKQDGLELKDSKNSKNSKISKRKWRKKSNKNKKVVSSSVRSDSAPATLEGSSFSMSNGSSSMALSTSSQNSAALNQALGGSMTLNINIQFKGKNDGGKHSVSVSSVSVESTDTVVVHNSVDSMGLISNSPKKALSPIKSPLSPRKGLGMFNSPKSPRGPKVLFKSPNYKHLAFRREKNNSTSTLFIKDTLNSPNVDEILRCMSVALLYHIKNGLSASEDKLARVFSEKYYPLTKEYVDVVNLPDVSTIYRFIKLIFRVQKLPPECAILCLAYIERILGGQKIVLHPENWRRIVFGSIIIATKVWEDESVWNVDFLDLFPLLTLNDLNNTENKFLELLQFNVLIHGSEYAKYYFELRALSQFDSFPLEPLNKETQYKLELRSNSYKSFVPPCAQKDTNQAASVSSASIVQDAVPTSTKVAGTVGSLRREMTIPKRCRSVDYFNPKSPPIVLQ